jgi:hypothetical protein
MMHFYPNFRNVLDRNDMALLRDATCFTQVDGDEIRLFLQHPEDETSTCVMEFNDVSRTMDMVENNWMPQWLVRELERDMTIAVRLSLVTIADLNNARIMTPNHGPSTPPFGEFGSPSTIAGDGEEIDELALDCRGCRYNLGNQQAHYGGCMPDIP